MTVFLTIVHIIVCLLLILVVLAQQGKGQDLASAFGGGGSSTAFGARGAATFLAKVTTIAAIIFMLTSLGLTYFRPSGPGRTVVPAGEAPVEQPLEGDVGPEESAPPGEAPVEEVDESDAAAPESQGADGDEEPSEEGAATGTPPERP